MVVQFSNKGHLLAVAGVSRDLAAFTDGSFGHSTPFRGACHSISLVDPDTGAEVWRDAAAHFGVVYDLKWSLNDRYLLSCSADGVAKVFSVHSHYQLTHFPAVFIYAAIFQEFPIANGAPASESACPPVLTGAEDGCIRVWGEQGLQLGQLTVAAAGLTAPGKGEAVTVQPHQGMVQALVIDARTKYLLSGDSKGFSEFISRFV
jgi:WD40 repeat protein